MQQIAAAAVGFSEPSQGAGDPTVSSTPQPRRSNCHSTPAVQLTVRNTINTSETHVGSKSLYEHCSLVDHRLTDHYIPVIESNLGINDLMKVFRPGLIPTRTIPQSFFVLEDNMRVALAFHYCRCWARFLQF